MMKAIAVFIAAAVTVFVPVAAVLGAPSFGIFMASPPNVGTTYYAALAGSSGNNGTSPATPWDLPTALAHMYLSGQSLLLNGGDNFSACPFFVQGTPGAGQTSINGIAGHPVTLGYYGTGQPTITANCSGSMIGAVTLQSVSYVNLNGWIIRGNAGGAQYGILLTNPTGVQTGNITITDPDISGFYTTNTADWGGEIVYHSYPGVGGMENITIQGDGATPTGCYLHGTTSTSPDDNGIAGYGDAQNNINFTVQHCTVAYIGGKANGIPGEEGNGIEFTDMNGGLIQYNVAHDNNANVNTCGSTFGMWVYSANNVQILNNEVYNQGLVAGGCDGGGYDIDAGSTNITVAYNYSHDNSGPGILLFDAATASYGWGPNYVHHNISVNDAQKGSGAIQWAPVQSTDTAQIFNNTFYNTISATTGNWVFGVYDCVGPGSLFANNIMYTSLTGSPSAGQYVYLNYNSGATSCTNPLLMNNNGYYLTGGSAPSAVKNLIGTNTYTTLSSWWTASGETASTSANPLIASLPSSPATACNSTSGPAPCPANFDLQNTSTYINGGAYMLGAPYNVSAAVYGTVDYYGNALAAPGNIGAYGKTTSSGPLLTTTGPTSGNKNVASTNFTVTIINTSFNGSNTVTITDGSQGGTFTPSVGTCGSPSTCTVTPSNAATSFTFTYTPVVSGNVTLSIANSASWSEAPTSLVYNSLAPTLSNSGPSTGLTNAPSTNFTVSLANGTFNGSQTATITDGSKGGTFTPSVGSCGSPSTCTVTPTNGATSFTFTYTPVVGGNITLTFTNAQSWTETPSTLVYNSASNKTVYVSGNGTDGAGCGLSTGSPCQTLGYVCNPSNFSFNGGDTIAINAASAVTVNNPSPTTVCGLFGPSAYVSGTQNVFNTSASKPLTVTSYGGSGSCQILAGTTSGCGTINVTGTTYSGYCGNTCGIGIFEIVNASFVTVQNLRIIGTANTYGYQNFNATIYEPAMSYGVLCGAAAGVTVTNCTVTNNEIVDFAILVYMAQTVHTSYPSSGQNNFPTVTNNLLHSSSRNTYVCGGTTFVQNWVIDAIFFEGVNNLFNSPPSASTGLVQGNLMYYIDGIPNFHICTTNPNAYPSSPLLSANGSNSILFQFNVSHDSGGNNWSCGAGYHMWPYRSAYNYFQFNEGYNFGGYPQYGGACDQGFADFDGDTVNDLYQYNYAHDDEGSCVNWFDPDGGSTNDIARYNICVNEAYDVDSVLAFGADDGTEIAYNNTVWNTVPYHVPPNSNGHTVVMWGQSTCGGQAFVANNIFANVPNIDGTVRMGSGTDTGLCSSSTFISNDYYTIGGSSDPQWWYQTGPGGATYTSLAAWAAVAPGGEAGSITGNPQLTAPNTTVVYPPSDPACYSGSGIPTGPQSCPTGYEVSTTSSPVIGTGANLTLSPYNFNVGTRDYYGNTIPHGHGTGYNMGADGGYP